MSDDAIESLLAATFGVGEPSNAEAESEYSGATFDFEADFQDKIAALYIRDSKFARHASGLIKPEYFEREAQGILFSVFVEYFEMYRTIPVDMPTVKELFKGAFERRRLRAEIKDEVINEYRRLRKVSLENGKFVLERVNDFARHQAIQNFILSAADWLKKNDHARIIGEFEKVKRIGTAESVTELDFWSDIERRTEVRKEKLAGTMKPTGITTGIKELDRNLYHKGWGRKELSVIMGGAKKGKCVTRDTILLTEHGMLDIGDYVPSTLPVDQFYPHEMMILGRDGMERTSHIYNNGVSDTLRITTNRGYEIEGTYNHPMLFMDIDGDLKWKHLNDAVEGDWLVVQRGSMIFGKTTDILYASDSVFTSRCDASITLPKEMTPDLAEFLGLIVAEAYFSDRGDLNFTQKDPVIVKRYEELLWSLFNVKPTKVERRGSTALNVSRQPLKRFLEKLGVSWSVSKEKVIPKSIRVAPKECFSAFLRALIGTECHARCWSENKVEIDLCMASERLIKEVQIALTNYGVISNRSSRLSCATNGTRKKRCYWRLKISGGANISVFRREIGLYETRRELAICNVELLPSTERNWIPNARGKIALAMGEFKAMGGLFREHLGESLARSLRTIRAGRSGETRHLTYHLAQQFIEKLDEYKVHGEGSDWLREMVRLNYAFDPIVSIEKRQAETVDFTVPKTHSFFANGLISHNSMGLGHFALVASKSGYNALYATLEVSSDIIAERMDANISKTAMHDLEDKMMAVKGEVERWGAHAGRGQLKVVEYPSGSLSPSMLRRLIDRHRNEGVIYDLIVVDYADIMRPDVITKDPIENSKAVWLDLRAIATEESVAVLTATQTNRTGYKADVAKAEDVAEDFNKVRIADVFLSINRNDEERDKGLARLFMAASRNGQGEITFKIKQDLPSMQFITEVVDVC